MSFHIRPAVSEDADHIIALIKDLAIYEKSLDRVQATPELIRRNLFENSYAHALLAFEGPGDAPKPGAKAIGLALYFFNFSTWTGKPGLYLEDLYVKPEFRANGLGKAFFAELGKVAQEKDCARMDWAVLDWNQPSIEFYEKKLGATAMKEWIGMRLEGEGIQNLQRLK